MRQEQSRERERERTTFIDTSGRRSIDHSCLDVSSYSIIVRLQRQSGCLFCNLFLPPEIPILIPSPSHPRLTPQPLSLSLVLLQQINPIYITLDSVAYPSPAYSFFRLLTPFRYDPHSPPPNPFSSPVSFSSPFLINVFSFLNGFL